jgi:hypothetical protein
LIVAACLSTETTPPNAAEVIRNQHNRTNLAFVHSENKKSREFKNEKDKKNKFNKKFKHFTSSSSSTLANKTKNKFINVRQVFPETPSLTLCPSFEETVNDNKSRR